jgi:preprotein translocase subunit SecG
VCFEFLREAQGRATIKLVDLPNRSSIRNDIHKYIRTVTMINMRKTNNARTTTMTTTKRANSFVLCISLLFVVVVSATQQQQQEIPSSSLQQKQQQQQQRELQANGRPSLIEPSQCIPREVIRTIHEDPNDTRLPYNTQYIGVASSDGGSVQTECYTRNNSCGTSDGTAPSACCRISFDAGWLVCDAMNGFEWMPCVCNDNTNGSPTPEPTMPPLLPLTDSPTTKQPTDPPTMEPTRSTISPTTRLPTQSPTKAPTEPSNAPTEKPITGTPTREPTQKPTPRATTQSPTKAPIVKRTNAPTDRPIETTTNPPTTGATTEDTSGYTMSSPTVAPIADVDDTSPVADVDADADADTTVVVSNTNYKTENRYDDELSATVLQSQCNEPPPVIEFVQMSNFIYHYEVNNRDEEDEDNEMIFNDIHNQLAKEFMVCDYEQDTVWIIQSKTHVVDESVSCTQEISSIVVGSNSNKDAQKPKQGATPKETDDENSNDSPTNNENNTCVVMKAEARIIAYEPPIKRKTNKQLISWTDDYESGPTADAYAQAAINFINEKMNAGDFDRDGLILSFDGGEVLPAGDGNNNDNTVVDTDTGTTNNDEGNENSDASSSSPNAGTTDSSSSTVGGGSNDSNNNNIAIDGNGNSAATSGNTAVGIEDSSNNSIINDSERKGGLTAPILATVVVASAFIVLLLLIGVSHRRKRNRNNNNNKEEEDEEYLRQVGANDISLEYAMGINHHLDLSDSDHSRGGDMDEPGPVVRSQLDLEDNNDIMDRDDYYLTAARNSSNNSFVRSPSSRQRSTMSPLSSLDELDNFASSGRTGSHRSSSGIQQNNKDPRPYQLRDTVKL